MKKRFLILAMSVALVCALVGGTTFALFTDSATNSAKNFTAGTVDISSARNAGDNVPGPMFYTTETQGQTPDGKIGKYPTGLWQPGDNHVRHMVVVNKGSLDVKLTRVKASIDGNSDIQPGSEAYNEFITKMKVKIFQDNGNVLYEGPLSGLLGAGSPAQTVITLSPYNPDAFGPIASLSFECTLDLSAGNSLQGKKPVFSLSLVAEQLKNNP